MGGLQKHGLSLKLPGGLDFLANIANSPLRKVYFQEGKCKGWCSETPALLKIISRGQDKLGGYEHVYTAFHSSEMTQNSELVLQPPTTVSQTILNILILMPWLVDHLIQPGSSMAS